MPKYKPGDIDSGYDSEYEDKEGIRYSAKKPLGTGYYAHARKFEAKLEKTSKRKKVVVLSPATKVSWSEDEIERKIRFFKTLYSDKKSEYFKEEKRAVVPYIKGDPLSDMTHLFKDQGTRISTFKSVAEAVKQAHDKGLVLIDLYADNILYNSKQGKCYLIDGGLAHTVKEPILEGHQIEEMIHFYKTHFPQFAPECFSLPTEKASLAESKMDVYSLGIMMERMIPETDLTDEWKEIISQCLNPDPEKRPTIEKVIKSLEELKGRKSLAP